MRSVIFIRVCHIYDFWPLPVLAPGTLIVSRHITSFGICRLVLLLRRRSDALAVSLGPLLRDALLRISLLAKMLL